MGRQMTAEERLALHDVLEMLGKVRPCAGGYVALCPAHEDRRASLSVTEGTDGRILMHCHAGCEFASIAAALGVSESALCGEREERRGSRIVAEYDYVDEAGALLYQAVRLQPKDFRQRRPDGHGGWVWSLGDVRRVIFRLPEVLAAKAIGETIFIVEGEKDVLSLAAVGLTATCNAGGVDDGKGNKWRREFGEILAGATIVIIPDNDDVGRRHAEWVKSTIPSSRIVELPGLPPKGDVSDWLQTHTREELEALLSPPSPTNDVPGILRKSTAGGSRFPVGIPPLDTALAPRFDPSRVGFPLGRIVVLNGAPWQGKSVLACQLGLRLALAGVRVLHFVIDEPREDAAERIGQGLGFRHAELNAEYPATLDELACRLSGVDLSIIPDDDQWETPPTIEQAGEMLLAVPSDAGHALVVDSIHSVSSSLETDGDPERKRIEKRVRALRRLRKRGVLVIGTSEVARAAYAAKDPDQRTRGIAAGAESRAIEYGADLLLFLSEGDDETVNVEISKNRIGRKKGSFVLRLNPGAAQFGAVAEEAMDQVRQARRDETLLSVESKVITFLQSISPDRASGAAIEAEKLAHRNDVRAALRVAVEKGTIKRTKAGRGGGYLYEV